MSYSLKMYKGPAISASMPTWGKNPFLTAGGALRRRKVSNLEQIPDSPHKASDFEPRSLTTLHLLNEDSKDRSSPAVSSGEEKKPWGDHASKEHVQDRSKMSESDEAEDDGEGDLQVHQEEEVFRMDL